MKTLSFPTTVHRAASLRPGDAGAASLRSFRPVLRSSLLAVGDAYGVERSANDVIPHPRQVFHTAAADHHNRVLLQVMADAGNIGGHFNSVGEPHARDFAQRRVRLLGSLRVHACADAALLRARLQRRARRLVARARPAITNQLIKRRHSCSLTLLVPARVERRSGISPKTNSQMQPSGLDSLAIHASGAHTFTQAGGSFSLDKSGDGGLKPGRGEVPFRQLHSA